jgi:iron complex transport system substrate-binding protein
MGSCLPMYPERIVCLTEETTETLYMLGEGRRVVGISGYTLRPPEARAKPKVSSFISARFEKIEALKPDLILTFSDLQADIASELVRRGWPVFAFNQRSVVEILQMIRVLAGLIGCEAKGQALAAELERGLDEIRRSATSFASRPRTFFEEWDNPLISGIQWVEELIEIAGGEPIFPELREKRLAKDRIVREDDVLERKPDVILASWCGKRMKKSVITSRAGWTDLPALRHDRIYEIPSTYILQPGPAALTEGVRLIHERLAFSANGAHSTATLDGIKRFS